MSAGELPDAWRGFTPEQMTEKLRDRAKAKRSGGTYTSNVSTDRLLDEAADLIDWLAKDHAREIERIEREHVEHIDQLHHDYDERI